MTAAPIAAGSGVTVEESPLLQERNFGDLRGMAYDEVAATLGIPIGTVRSRLNAARAELRRALEP